MGEHYQEHRIQPRGLRFSQVALFVVHPHGHSVFFCCKGHPCDLINGSQGNRNSIF